MRQRPDRHPAPVAVVTDAFDEAGRLQAVQHTVTDADRRSSRRPSSVGPSGPALGRYEQFMRTIVDATPMVRTSVLRRANPHSRAGIATLHAGARVLASPVARAAMNVLGRRLVNVSVGELPDYPPPGA
jgi:hypothetical protein